ncbi:MAG: hypothetical protein JKX94_12580, partial [Sneathiella sp.]|nr:hypothetical protein [Sneathiella sp.]
MVTTNKLSFHDWIVSIGLEKYLAALEIEEIDLDIVETLSDSDLKELGISKLGDRRRFLKAVEKRFQAGPAQPS